MWLAGGRSLLFSSLLLLFIITISLLCSDCRVGAIRLNPPNAGTKPTQPPHQATTNPSKTHPDLFQKYFGGSASDLNTNTTRDGNFQNSKRRVPSCPDPLHN
ncbi:CLE27p like [Actinidia chinensis var. chinensis]|uniref:CLE27p like n=1 Tax=Actinidia chinensis var. chinensis TaxID=1590841 RepID=A0A2R6PH10_ACTCC|nr:CLE27p like [Actinidia chinensis var. chinensis]